jgi:hypothetical protein
LQLPLLHSAAVEQALQLSAHLIQVGATHEYPLSQSEQVSMVASQLIQFAGVHASHFLSVPLYLNPFLQVVHSVLLAQIAQFAIQASQTLGVVVLKFQPSLHKVQTVLLF